MSADALDRWHTWWRAEVADRAPAEQLADGSAAGLAELGVRGRTPEDLPGAPFGRPRADELWHLVDLARTGTVDEGRAGVDLLIPPISAHWAKAFEGLSDGWWGRLMLAIRAQASGDLQRAEQLYEDSRAIRPTAWADRGLAVLASGRGDDDRAASHYRDAVRRQPECLPLLVEATEQLLTSGRPGACLELIDYAPATLREHGRVVLQRCRALVAAGRLEEAQEVLADGFEVPDLREGETLGALWQAVFDDRPLPAAYDFRMV
jgi:tetratricopeptide (TPR) repeat protein